MHTRKVNIQKSKRAKKEKFHLPADSHALLVNNNLEGLLALLDINGKILYRNDYPGIFNQVLQRPLQTGDYVSDLTHPYLAAASKQLMSQITGTPTPVSITVRTTDLQGFELYIEIICKNLSVNESEFIHVEAKEVTKKILQKKSLESKVTELSAFLRMSLEVKGSLF